MFQFKQFSIKQDKAAMKVGTDGVLLGAWADVSDAKLILDIGAGTGLIALMCAQRNENAQIYAVEIDADAQQQIVENFENSPWNDRLHLEATSFQAFVSKTNLKFDAIVCNPPFFENAVKNPCEKRTTARHNDSLLFNDLAVGIKRVLLTNGKFSLVLPPNEYQNFEELAKKHHLFCARRLEVYPNHQKGIKRILSEWRHESCDEKLQSIVIENDARHHYTDEYKQLTKDFYLAF